jgi:hypothetical protein
MALLDDLTKILGEEAVGKIKADSNISKRLNQGDEFFRMYVGLDDATTTADTTTAAATTTSAAPVTATATTATSTASPDLMAELRKINQRLDTYGDIPKTIETELGKAKETYGRELRQGVVVDALMMADDVFDMKQEYRDLTGKKLDRAEFNTFIEEQKKANRLFHSVRDAYDAYTEPLRRKKEIDDAVEADRKVRATNNVPGVTPPSSNSTLAALMNAGKTSDKNGETAVDRAARRLQQRINASANAE